MVWYPESFLWRGKNENDLYLLYLNGIRSVIKFKVNTNYKQF